MSSTVEAQEARSATEGRKEGGGRSAAIDRALLRRQLLEDPELILSDREVMRALVAANDRHMGDNVIDLRGMALERLERRLDRLEETHAGVLTAAYENLAAAERIHRAVLAVLEPLDFTEFLSSLKGEVADILQVDVIRLCLESPASGNGAKERLQREYGEVLGFFAPGSIEEYLTEGRNMAARDVTIRQTAAASASLFGARAPWIRSEGLLRLDLGAGNLPGLLAMGSEDPHHFHPSKGTDLLAFFGGVFERSMRRWLE